MKKFYTPFLAALMLILLSAAHAYSQVNLTATGGVTSASYTTLKQAFDAINAGTHTGVITIGISGNTTETASAVLNASGSGSSSYTSVLINPTGGAARTISGDIAGNLIDLNGADNVTINGLKTGGNSLTIANISALASSTISFSADASNNTVTNCALQGSTTSFGVVNFGTGTVTGNDNDIISNCDIGPAGANLPLNGIYSLGSSAVIDNSNITVSGNNIFDFFSATGATNGLNINSFNSTWTITNNRLYQTATRLYTTANTHTGINITSGSGYTITGNIIGYANSSGTGTTNMIGNSVALGGTFPSSYTVTGTANASRYIAISCAYTAAGTISQIQNNTIAGFALYTSSGAATTTGIFCGIAVTSGNVNIGTTTGNTIGATSGTGSIYTACTTTSGMIAGIYVTSSNAVAIRNNTIGALDAMGTDATICGGINGINLAGAASSYDISGNTIGNTTNPNQRMGNLTTGANLSNVGTTFGSVTGLGTFNGILNSNTGPGTIGTAALPNIIRNASLNTTSASTSASFRGITSSGIPVISSNIINNLITASANVGVSSTLLAGMGIFLNSISTSGIVVTGNVISSLSLTNAGAIGTNLAGIAIYCGSSDINKNKIYDLQNASTSVTTTAPGTASGFFLRQPAGAQNINNNMVSLGNGQTTNTAFNGIWQQNSVVAYSLNAYYNSFNIEGTVASGAQPSFCLNRGSYSATQVLTPVDIRDNLFNNTRSGGTGKHYAIGNDYGATASATGWGTNASNYNVLNANTATVGYWNTDQTFVGWKTASACDANSVSNAAVTFTNTATGDLHINMGTTPNQIESGGVVITGFTTDFDNQTRPGPPGSVNGGGFAPDLGADEFDGVMIDLFAPNIAFTPFLNTSSLTARTLTTTISDATGVPTSGTGLPRLYWKKFWIGTWNSVQGVYVSGSTYTFTFGGGVVLNDSIYYYIVAQDIVSPTPNIGSNPSTGAGGFTINPPACSTAPTTPYSYKIVNTICGSINVGAGQTYTSLTAAVTDLTTNREMTCPVTLVLTDASYSAGETFPIIFYPPAGSSSINTVTIKPASGVTPTITGSSTTGIFVIYGANYLIIDGSNSGGSDKSLTWENTNIAANTYTIGVFNNGVQGASNDVIKNCNIKASPQVSSSTYALILNAAGGGYNNIIINNNNIYSARYGLQVAGTTANPATNTQVTNNTIGTTTDATAIQYCGILVGSADNTLIQGNEVMGAPSGNTNTQQPAISLLAGATNTKIRSNKIHDFYYTGTGGYGTFGVYCNTGSAATPTEISNNVIYALKADGYGASITYENPAGICLYSGGNYQIYHNSVNMTGATLSASYSSFSSCLFLYSGITLVDARDNIFKNSQTPTSGTLPSTYAVYSVSSNSAFSTINYNDYFVNGVNPNIGYLAAAQATLAAWKTATGQDANSINVDPLFTSATNLLPTATTMNNAGTYMTAVPNDINGTLRSNPPDMGAYEFALDPLVNTTAAGSVTSNSATLNGTINANNFTVNSFFDYGLTTAYGTSTAGVPASVSGSTTTGISLAISGLTQLTTYHYRARGVTTGGLIAYGPDMTFTTASAPPTVVTTAATLITTTGAQLNGTVNANGASSTVIFDYGLTVAYGSTVTATQSPVSGTSAVVVSAPVAGLSPATLYHFRVRATNTGGTTNGNDMTFTTLAVPPVVVTNPASGIGVSTATLNGTVTANNASTTVSFDWGLTIAYGNNVAATPSPVTGNTPTAVSAGIGGLTSGLTYHFRCVGTNSGGTTYGSDQSFVAGCQMPAAAGAIIGPNSVCANSSGKVYTVGAITNATSYTWTVPAGAVITAGAGTTSITVTFGAASGNVTVLGTNSCGNGTPSSLTVTVNPLPTPTITGNASVCQGTSNVYTTQAGMTGYTWTVSAGGTITAGAGTSSITVLWNSAGAQTVSVNYTNANGCAAASPVSYAVTVTTAPAPTITGQASMCVNSGYYNYTTQTGFTNYIWTISAGGTITFGQGTNVVQVTWNQPGAQWVAVNYTNANGCTASAPVQFPVTVNPLPGAAGNITGTAAVCGGTNGVAYSVAPVQNASAYVWTLPAGATIVTGAGTNSITVNFAANASSGNITVYANNLCGNGSASPPFVVTLTPLAAAAGTIAGQAAVCQGTNGVIYTVDPITNATGYTWTVPTGATIVSGANTNSITVNFSASAVSGVITVYGTNSCGNGGVSPDFNVTVNPIPAAPVISLIGDTLFSSNYPTGNQWYFNGVLIPGATGQTLPALISGEYWDVVTINGCSSAQSNHIQFVAIGIDPLRVTRYALYPVPNDGCFTVTMNSPAGETINIYVYNDLGSKIFEMKDVKVKGTVEQVIDLRPVPSGVYSVIFQGNNGKVIRRILIK